MVNLISLLFSYFLVFIINKGVHIEPYKSTSEERLKGKIPDILFNK